jgi:aminopeptidase N
LHIPVETALLNTDGATLPLQLEGAEKTGSDHLMLELHQPSQQFVFTGVAEKPTVSLLRGFSAPVKVNIARSEAELCFLFAHDPDPFNRWDAGQSLAIKVLLKLIESVQQNRPLALADTVSDAFHATLVNDQLDAALIAQALTLPSDAYLADQCDVVDVDAIHTARQFVASTLAERLYDAFLTTYQRLNRPEPYRFSAQGMAQRSLKNLCLAYLLESGRKEPRELCSRQLEHSHNMSDTLAALSALAHHDWPERQMWLDRFYGKWHGDTQVVDKWFSIQAGSRLPDTLQQVQKLLTHPAFRLTNPNKVRALIGRFCQGNPVRFHAADGSGYRLLGAQVLELDKINPQIAARLISTLSRWNRYDDTRKALMKSELQRIRTTAGLSKDVFEIVSKSLDA